MKKTGMIWLAGIIILIFIALVLNFYQLKILGIILIVLGFAILKFFPDVTNYQSRGFTMTGILIGILFILVGIGLLIFG